MSELDKLREVLIRTQKIKNETREARDAYVMAEEEQSQAFCLYANKLGWRDASRVLKEVIREARRVGAIPETNNGHEAAPPQESEPIIQQETREHPED